MSLYTLTDDAKGELAEEHQERMCNLCELHILGCSSNSVNYQCEGSRCDEAIEYLIDDLEDERLETEMFPIY